MNTHQQKTNPSDMTVPVAVPNAPEEKPFQPEQEMKVDRNDPEWQKIAAQMGGWEKLEAVVANANLPRRVFEKNQ